MARTRPQGGPRRLSQDEIATFRQEATAIMRAHNGSNEVGYLQVAPMFAPDSQSSGDEADDVGDSSDTAVRE